MNNRETNEYIAKKLRDNAMQTTAVYPLYDDLDPGVRTRLTRDAFERKVRKVRAILQVGKQLPQSSDKVAMTVEGNMASIEVNETDRVKTLEDLLVEAQVDLSIWKVDSYTVNKWEMASKAEGETEVIPLYQVKVRLSRIAPAIPTIIPLSTPEFRRIPSPQRLTTQTVMILGDAQMGFSRKGDELIPYHDRPAMDCTLRLAKEIAPDTIVVLGDMLDMTEASRFAQKPEFQRTLQPAINELGWFFKELRVLCPLARIVFLAGNHENRLIRSIMENLSFAYDLKAAGDLIPFYSLRKLLALDAIDVELIEEYPAGILWLSDNLKVVHGEYVKASKELETSNDSVIMGHLHRMETHSKTVHHRTFTKTVQTVVVGCLCKVDGTVPGVTSKPNWQQGIVVVEMYGNHHQINHIPIQDGHAIYLGQLFKGADYSYRG